jgi:hypothetical protein
VLRWRNTQYAYESTTHFASPRYGSALHNYNLLDLLVLLARATLNKNGNTNPVYQPPEGILGVD